MNSMHTFVVAADIGEHEGMCPLVAFMGLRGRHATPVGW